MNKYIALIGVEIYLIVTLLLLYFGPINFRLHSPILFFILMILYHGFFIAGYLLGAKTHGKFTVKVEFSRRLFYGSFVLGLVGILISYQNLLFTDSLIPYTLFDDLYKGLSEPGLVYSERMMGIDAGITSGSRLFNIVSFFIAFFKLLFIFQFVYFWRDLALWERIMSVVYSLLFISPGIASGTNSVVFLFFIFSIISLITVFYKQKYKHFPRLFTIISILFLVPVLSFGYIMSQRGGGFEYFSSTSPLNDISVAVATPSLVDFSLLDYLYYSFVWLDYYVVQGYYGFSLIINMDHNWTFGFGNSAFLQRQLQMLADVDISSLTFQHRISSVWDESAQWHSFYGQFANDFGILGLVFFLFLLGFLFSRIWCSFALSGSFYGAALLPIFALMFIFFPANNQVFGYIDTLSYFIFVTILWFFEGKKIRSFA